VIRKANEMGTTLWFSDEDAKADPSMLDALVMAGQATMCQNLILYLEDLKKEIYPVLPVALQAELDQIHVACQRDFEQFGEDPAWLMKLI